MLDKPGEGADGLARLGAGLGVGETLPAIHSLPLLRVEFRRTIDEMLLATGGFPGASSSECGPGCLCALEVA